MYVAPRATTAPATSHVMPRPLMIIPKKALERDQKPTKIAAAQ
jgi:hypothetical protein